MLTEVNRWVGVVIAVVGAVVVAPEGTRLLLKGIRAWFRRRGQQVRDQLARFLPFLRQDVNIQVKATGGSLSTGVALLGSARGCAWDPSAPVDERIEKLLEYIAEIERQMDTVNQRLAQETSDRQQAVAELRVLLDAELADQRRLLDKREEQAAAIDARGLPVIGWGILLSGVPDRLAQIPFYLGWVFPTVGVILGLAAGVPAWREYRARPR